MYNPILKQASKTEAMAAVSDLEANIFSMHEELVRTITELYEKIEEWEEKYDTT